MSSGPAFVRLASTAGGPHHAVPAGGTYFSELTGQPVMVLTDAASYPLRAECQVCRGPIRLAELRQMEWRHATATAVAAAAAVPSAPVSPGRGQPGAGFHPPAPGSAPPAGANGEG